MAQIQLKMKRHLHNSFRALFLSIAVLLSLPMLAVEIEINGINYELVAKIKEATVIAKSSGEYFGEVVIPESVEHEGTTYSVTSIGAYAFYNFDGLTSVTIPNSVKSIGKYSFEGCSSLTSVTIGNSVTSIGDCAFWDCSGLEKIELNCKYIGYWFSGFKSIKEIIIGNSVESIGEKAFRECSGLTSVTIGNSVTSIGRSAFYACSGLTSVIIPNSVESIGEYAFSYCFGLTSVTIPNSVTSIVYMAFYGCSGLKSVTIGSGVKTIESYSFADCPKLHNVYCYAEKVPSTHRYAFDGSDIEYAYLHVPAASIESYKATSPWSKFGKIVALTEEETGIDEVKGENANVKTAVYDLSGRRVQKVQKGIFIQNGKVMLK